MKKKGDHIAFFIMLIILLILIPLVAKCGNDLINSGFEFTLFGEGYFKGVMNINTFKEFFRFNNPLNAMGMAALLLYVVSYILNKVGSVKNLSEYEQLDGYGSHGTQRWQTKEELRELYGQDDVGWFLGSTKQGKGYSLDMKNGLYHAVENELDLNMQFIVVGAPGSKKTTGFILPNLFHIPKAYKERGKNKHISKIEQIKKILKLNGINDKNMKGNCEMPDLITTDPKPELYPLTAKYLERMGYDIKVLDFIDLKYGDSLNVLDFINDDKTLMQIAKGYIDSVGGAEGNNGGEQQFWNDQESQVLAALMGFIKQKYSRERQNIGEVAKLLISEDIADIDNARLFFKKNNIKGAANQFWDNFLMIADSERTRANILGGLAEKLKLFAIEGVQGITNTTTIDISKLGAEKEKPMAIFILMPDEDRTYSPIINVMINSIFSQMYKTARKSGSRLERPVYMLFDEMANIGKIPNIKERLGGMRGRRIYPMMIWQSLAQMRDRYKDGYEDIISQCDTQIYLGINDPFTAKICSESLGNTTIKIQGTGNQNSGFYAPNNKSENFSYQPRNLLMPEECRKFNNKELIMWQRSVNPIRMYKVQYRYWLSKICKKAKVEDLPLLGQKAKLNIESEKYVDVNMSVASDETIDNTINIKNKDVEDDLSIDSLRSMMYDE